MALDDIDCWRNKDPVCPHCGSVFDLTKDDRGLEVSYEDGGSSEWTCDACRKPFVSVTVVGYTYSTAIDLDHADDELWGPQEVVADELETQTT